VSKNRCLVAILRCSWSPVFFLWLAPRALHSFSKNSTWSSSIKLEDMVFASSSSELSSLLSPSPGGEFAVVATIAVDGVGVDGVAFVAMKGGGDG